MPRATLETTSETNEGVGIRAIGSSMHGSPSSGTKVRSAATVTPSMRKWWLAVAHIPVAVQVALDADVVGPDQRATEQGMAVDEPFDAVGVDPVGVLTTAGEAPAPLDAVAVRDRGDGAGRVEGAGHDAVWPGGEDGVEGGPRQRDRSTQAPPPIMTIHATDAVG